MKNITLLTLLLLFASIAATANPAVYIITVEHGKVVKSNNSALFGANVALNDSLFAFRATSEKHNLSVGDEIVIVKEDVAFVTVVDRVGGNLFTSKLKRHFLRSLRSRQVTYLYDGFFLYYTDSNANTWKNIIIRRQKIYQIN